MHVACMGQEPHMLTYSQAGLSPIIFFLIHVILLLPFTVDLRVTASRGCRLREVEALTCLGND